MKYIVCLLLDAYHSVMAIIIILNLWEDKILIN